METPSTKVASSGTRRTTTAQVSSRLFARLHRPLALFLFLSLSFAAAVVFTHVRACPMCGALGFYCLFLSFHLVTRSLLAWWCSTSFNRIAEHRNWVLTGYYLPFYVCVGIFIRIQMRAILQARESPLPRKLAVSP